MEEQTLNEQAENCVIINAMPLTIKEYNDKRVVTFKDIDMLHGRPEGTARKRFNSNRKHFIEGEDYFVRKTDEAQREFGINAPNGLTLITESGYLMLVKSFTDDLAWEVQRALVKSYFRQKSSDDLTPTMRKALTAIYKEIHGLRKEFAAYKDSSTEQKALPLTPNFLTWKSQISTPLIKSLAKAMNIETRTAFDLVYNTMSEKYGFNRSFALGHVQSKYGDKSLVVIDAIADEPIWQTRFVEIANLLIDNATRSNKSRKFQTVDADSVEAVIRPLVEKLNDKSAHGIQTLGKVYAEMHSKRGWGKLLSANKCKNKKQLICKRKDEFDKFCDVVRMKMDSCG